MNSHVATKLILLTVDCYPQKTAKFAQKSEKVLLNLQKQTNISGGLNEVLTAR